mmetsp:Transcript_31544/g.34478  ORF Transcript_31544/g.34478 Transcript_31544/m.34478 type:complete len:119 (-) Transcript_31544:841-1197(-)
MSHHHHHHESERELEREERELEFAREQELLREAELQQQLQQQQFQQQSYQPAGRRAPRTVEGRYKHSHLFHHHGKLNYQVPAEFFIGQDTEFSEPGGEIIVFRIPEDSQPGDDLIIEF